MDEQPAKPKAKRKPKVRRPGRKSFSPTPEKGGRPPKSLSAKRKDQATITAYLMILEELVDRPTTNVAEIIERLKQNGTFLDLVRRARRTLDRRFIRAATRWLNDSAARKNDQRDLLIANIRAGLHGFHDWETE